MGAHDRSFQLGRAWQAQGHSLSIFMAAYHHLLQGNGELMPELSIQGVRYLTVPARRYQGNGRGRLLNMWDYVKNLGAIGAKQAADGTPDVVIVSSPHPFSMFAAFRLAKRYDAKLVFEIRDIWPLSVTEILGTSPLHPFVLLCGYAEKFAIKKADLVTSVLPRADRYLEARGYGEKPYAWVPNGKGPRDSSPRSGSDGALKAVAIAKAWRDKGKVVVVHAGSLGKPNAIDLLIEALAYGRSVGEADGCCLLLVGGGLDEMKLRILAQSLGLSDIHFTGQLPKDDIQMVLEYADIGYAGVRNHKLLYSYGVSLNKFSDYYQASLPVFLPIAPCGDPVSESGGGVVTAAETPAEVWQGLSELIQLSVEARKRLGDMGNAYMSREYDYDLIARRYVDAIETIFATA